jgi:hypothetical protein
MKQSFMAWDFSLVLSCWRWKVSDFEAFYILGFQSRDAQPVLSLALSLLGSIKLIHKQKTSFSSYNKLPYLMSSSVTMKALQRGWDVFSQTAGFFSTAAETCPVIGAELVCKALATADKRVSSLLPGPTPAIRKKHHWQENSQCAEHTICDLKQPILCVHLGSYI